MEKEKKIPKTNRHFEIYLQYVNMYNVLKLKWTIQRGYSTEIQNIWNDMTRKLNGCGGPVRDVTHWKKVFTEWKSHTRRKLKCNKPLNDIEKQLVELTGLTSNPERTKNSVKICKNRASTNPESLKYEYLQNISKKNNDNQENRPVIKNELPDEVSYNDREQDTCGDETPFRNNKTKEISVLKGKYQGNNIRNEVNDQDRKQNIHLKPLQSSVNTNAPSKGLSRSSDISTQVDQGMLDMFSSNGFTSISIALQNLSAAVNRYCDIIEKKAF